MIEAANEEGMSRGRGLAGQGHPHCGKADSGDEQKAKGQGIIRNIPCAMITL
jgi:hypothetical protein